MEAEKEDRAWDQDEDDGDDGLSPGYYNAVRLGKGKSDVQGAVGAERRSARGWGKCQGSFQKPLALKSRCDHCRAAGGRGDVVDTEGRTACRARG